MGFHGSKIWLTLYLSVDSSDYARAVGSKRLIGAAARVFKPGCKTDTCLVLEGPQGLLKSTALRTLANPWFTDEIADLGTKDAAMQVRGVWVIELAASCRQGTRAWRRPWPVRSG
jgi:predicted P-loop ATPase